MFRELFGHALGTAVLNNGKLNVALQGFSVLGI